MADSDNPDGSEVADSQHEFNIIKHHVNFELPPSKPGQAWQSYPELPSGQDLNPDWDDPQQLEEIRRLLPNTWQKPWEDKNTYLETHYRLQREEAITMLRYSIKKFKENPTMMDDQETCIYTRVFVKGYLMTRLGPMCQVQFSTEKSGKKIRWTQTRRLTVGTLVAISTASDCFKTICMPAIISDHRIRDGLDQNPPTIHFQWTNLEDAVMDPNQELVMIETRFGYFEAVRHSMVGLQHVANTETPLDKYLVGADKSDLPAKYVQESPRMDIRSLVHHVPDSSSMTASEVSVKMAEVSEPLRGYPVIDGFDGQLSKYTNLDNSQLSAVHRILTKELAIVQGPPGTGKTFTSVQALQILLESQERGSNVIIVAAQTNHAVDQILIQLINLGFEVVRLGGRTQNEVIKKYSMYNLRRRAVPPRTHRADRDFRTFESARKKNIAMVEKAIGDVFPNELITPDTLRSSGIITERQLQSLQPEQTWSSAPLLPDQPIGPLAEWMGNQLVKVKLPDEEEPDFEGVEDIDSLDLDAEDYDLELDDCIVDEDENCGRIEGKFLPIRHLWTGMNPQHLTGDDLVIRRELQKSDLWDIDTKYRGAVYQHWQKTLLALHRQHFHHILADNVRISKNLKINRWYKDTKCIKSRQIEIIGCTTTGLCKYRGLLAALRPRTLLIEEAAETREANILSALYGSLQQLILVGDHQQLAPHCDTPSLGDEPYFMRVSMFERLVNLQMPFTVLNMQRRMISSLREILNPYYPSLQDHPVVTKGEVRPPVPGMALPSFFFHHTWTEGLDENLSRYNILEAEMIVQFIDYLLMNGVPPDQITVLTFYRGQKKKILTLFKNKMKHWAPFTNVFTVDSYQGEENDVVILSLVRSNGPHGPHQAGFLQDENRGVVSISRARRGFYIFGNMINLAFASTASWNMWGKVQQVFERQGRFGGDSRLPITCQNHGKTTWISHPEDWVNCHGGCDQKCPDKLGCGHLCGRQCHWVTHDKLICRQPCERPLACGHRCQQVCGESCLCTCAEFTGAYSHDEFLEDDAILQDQRRMGAAGSKGIRRGLSRGIRHPRGSRPEVGYNSGASRNSGQSIGHNASWTTFDARLDDEQRFNARKQGDQTGTSSAPPNEVGLAIQDTYRPVTLNDHGLRNVGQGVTAEPTTSIVEGNDLLSFDDDVETLGLTTRSLSLGCDPTDAEVFVEKPDGAGDRGTPRNEIQRGQCTQAISGNSQPNDAGITITTSSSQAEPIGYTSPRQYRPRRQLSMSGPSPTARKADKPEWESASLADTGSVVDEDDEGTLEDRGNVKQDDLILF
ncbi:P-loop containing nucleoside triphosphate hydrolase protein [Annulohypoxylon maeteangense]|uniref:P-loop containing nucleoside triphosphate hydrolase protein n=1 Tax=Annulohypoxylon maeteangense TaxID=1927788 RepID=UPI0020076F22|nr:P-loop containing nucleoside triphosphate hydrolase protein [Annulohypoxylon maeteangense]KAI0886446.1 P-loop containing nucleoside triphosphate hydrolase protein [Annulohypoxylon maeteangense]